MTPRFGGEGLLHLECWVVFSVDIVIVAEVWWGIVRGCTTLFRLFSH